jgi:hypothetical protein
MTMFKVTLTASGRRTPHFISMLHGKAQWELILAISGITELLSLFPPTPNFAPVGRTWVAKEV